MALPPGFLQAQINLEAVRAMLEEANREGIGPALTMEMIYRRQSYILQALERLTMVVQNGVDVVDARFRGMEDGDG